MNYVSVIITQVLLMLILILVGMLCNKLKIITPEGGKHLSSLLLGLVSPVVIFSSYQRDFDPTLLGGLGIAFVLSASGFALAIVLSYVFLRKNPRHDVVIERFSVVYSNCGFMGIPLVSALFGSEGVFYLTAVITAFNLLVWTHGVFTMCGRANARELVRALLSPCILAVVLGLVCFIARLRLPDVLVQAMDFISGMNTPLAMLIAGVTVAQTNLLKAFMRPRTYYVTLIKLLLYPAILVLLFAFLPFPSTVVLTVIVALASPTATMCTLFAIRFDKDALYASEIFAVTTLLSLLSLPLIVYFANLLIH